ncbi:MAG TPA: aldehyde dehydrogenase (NADP(+)) [Fimbriimonas sp.]|nr:aldehyde dehydrogenase (NADP(+)) [Fimbriimonas sp.]
MTEQQLTGSNLIGGRESANGTERIFGLDAASGVKLSGEFVVATETEIAEAVETAYRAQGSYLEVSGPDRARFLEAVADRLASSADEMVERAQAETALSAARLKGEMTRTTSQLRMFANLVAEGSWVDARIDLAGQGTPDLRRMLVPIGPTAIFGASNFPFAFSVAGGDTASALAAGCCVIVKAHPAHPGTSELAARAIVAAACSTGMPKGVFSMIHGGAKEGSLLVQQERLESVAFTGSQAAGRSLFDLAARRPRPIPVFAEMGSVNPVFILPGALSADHGSLAQGYAASLTLGVGQFCTNPGLVIGIGEAFSAFVTQVSAELSGVSAGTMLTSQIKDKYLREAARRSESVETVVAHKGEVLPALFKVSADEFVRNPSLAEELFGPSAVAVHCGSVDQLIEVAQSLHGQLTATVHASETDNLSALAPVLAKVAGRVIYNGFPTGVAVCPAMQHGGPYPATTDSRFTSVGTAAIYRFARPVAYQDWPQNLLPEELRNENSRGIWRTVNGSLTREAS